MALNFHRQLNGLQLVPQNTIAVTVLGEIRYNSTTNKLELFNGSVDPIVTENDTATLTNKTITGNIAANLINGAGSVVINSTGVVTLPNTTDTLVGKNTTDTLTNKIISGNTATNLVNGAGTFNFNSSGVITVPNATDTLVGKATTDILTNKTLTGNIAANLVNGAGVLTINSTGTVTIPNTTDTLVGKATIDTLTNKTISAASNTITGLSTANFTPIADKTILSNISGGAAGPSANTLTAIFDNILSSTQGSVIYRNAASWVTLPPGTSGQVLSTGGPAANPSWVNQSGGGSGTVTNVATGTGLTGGPITTTGTISLANTTVVAGPYTNTNLTVDAQGRITSASSGSGGGTLSVVSKTTNYTATLSDDVILCDDSSGDFTITLPTAVGNSGKLYRIKLKQDSLTRRVTIHAVLSQTIDGLINRFLDTLNEEYEIVSDGANWKILNHKCDTDWVLSGPTILSSTGGTGPVKGTIVTDNMYWRRIAGNFEIRIEYVQSTASAQGGTGNYLWGIPSGLAIDQFNLALFGGATISAATCFSSPNYLGSFISSAANANQTIGGVFAYDGNTVRMGGITTNQANANNSNLVGASPGPGGTNSANFAVAAYFSCKSDRWLA